MIYLVITSFFTLILTQFCYSLQHLLPLYVTILILFSIFYDQLVNLTIYFVSLVAVYLDSFRLRFQNNGLLWFFLLGNLFWS